MALGATRRGVLKGVLFDGLRPVIAGLATGMIAAAALASVFRVTLVFPASSDLFYGVPFYDPATLLGLSCFLAAVAALAALVPARRALRVDPLTALRQE
jgi:ABC-type lipoprotein release transport system permease subunit